MMSYKIRRGAFCFLVIVCIIQPIYVVASSQQQFKNSVPISEKNYNDFNKESLTDWDVSGYLKLLAKDTEGVREVEIDDLSLFLSNHINWWFNPFLEAEFFSVPLSNSEHSVNLGSGNFVIERLYNDISPTSGHRFRIGKFLAPVGQWNLVHAAPLVWTVERPLTTTFSFSNYITGFEYGFELNPFAGSRIDFYWQPRNSFDPKPLSHHPREYKQTIGSSWTISDDLDGRSSLDFQYARVKSSAEKRTTLSLHKAIYQSQWSYDGQAIYTSIADNNVFLSDWEGGGYLQVRYQYNQRLDQYVRGEQYHFAEFDNTDTSWLIGLRYRFVSMGNINIEYVSHSAATGDSLLISYNIMFGQ